MGEFVLGRIKKFVIDLDGTLAKWESGDHDISKIGDPLPGAVQFVNKLAADGSIITIFTRRMHFEDNQLNRAEQDEMYRLIANWLDKHGFMWDNIYNGQGKPNGTAFIDDRGVACRPQDNPNAYVDALTYIDEHILHNKIPE
jgi:hypothetical protein